MKKSLLTLVLTLAVMLANAVPAKHVARIVKLEDGSTITVYLRGDETYHFFTTTDGTPVIEVSEGTYRVVPEMKDSIYNRWTERSKVRNAHRFAKHIAAAQSGRHKAAFGYPTSYTGKKRGVIILVNFADLKMLSKDTKDVFTDQFNKVGYSENGHEGSVHDYFLDASYGKFDLEFDVYGPVTVSKSYVYYGQNDDDGEDMYPATMCEEAVKLADAQNTINWKDYDWDGDGEVDQVLFVYAGFGEAAGGSSSTIWPHEFSFSGAQIEYNDGDGSMILDGVTIDTYACSCELAGKSGTTMDGIGTACHEFSHCLGIPDLYDTSYSGGFGMGVWDVMHKGSYNGPNQNGEVPAGYTAYERWFAGWLDFTELKDPCYVKDMPALQDSAFAYIIYNEGNKDEYFILENRQNRGFFKYVNTDTSIHGMLAYHVDYDEEAWINDLVNNDSKHQRLSIIPAGKNYGTYVQSWGIWNTTEQQYATQLFPGTSNATALTNDSHTSYNGKLFNRNTDGTYCMNKPITDVAENNGLISFTFSGGIFVEAPVAEEATNIGLNSFTANWNAVEGADSYSIELSPVNTGAEEIISEDMSAFASVENDGTSDIGSGLDSYMQNPGWDGYRVYKAKNAIKLGSSKGAGYFCSPYISAPSSGIITVSLNAKAYNTDNTTLYVYALESDNTIIEEKTIEPSTEATDYTVTLNVTEDCYIDIENGGSKQRAYIYGITIYDGDASSDAKARKVISKQTIDGITGTSYTFTDLTESAYKYRVKTVSDDVSSVWSDFISVYLDPTAINAIDTKDATATYYNLKGMKVSSPSIPGIYLVKKGDKVRKMLIGR